MAKAKLKTVDRATSVSRDDVREVMTRTAQPEKMADSKPPKATIGQAVKTKK